MNFELKKPECCMRCGAPVQVGPEDTHVTCGYCGTVMEITRFTREEKRLVQAMEEMRASVEQARKEAEEARSQLLESGEEQAARANEAAMLRHQELRSQLNRIRSEYESAHAKELDGWYRWGEKAQRAGRYDEAIGHYQKVLASCQDEAEVYWRIVLCRYGVEYVEDKSSHIFIPTLTRMQVDSILDDDDYRCACRFARSEDVREYYIAQARHLEDVLRRYQYICGSEKPYDVFISVKQGDDNGHATPDSQVAMRLYYQLQRQGLKVFNSSESLLDKAGHEYEPYIMHALMTAKLLVVVASRDEYIRAPWVRNEWRRFRWLREFEGASGDRRLLVYSTSQDKLSLPPELGMIQMINAQTDASPVNRLCDIAAQLKPQKPEVRVEIKQEVRPEPKPIVKKDEGDEQFRRAMQLMYGKGVLMDQEQAASLLKQAAEKGHADAQFHLGLCHVNGVGVKEADAKEAADCFRKAASQGHACAMYWLAVCYEAGLGVYEDEDQAFVLYEQAIPAVLAAAESGDPDAMYHLADGYANGMGMEANASEAAKWYEKAAEAGVPEAMCALGMLYLVGEDGGCLGRDCEKAVVWLRKASVMGVKNAHCALGECYYFGNGVQQNDRQAVVCFRKAAATGDCIAANYLGDCYYEGRGVEADPEKAVEWYQKAAAEDADAQYRLGTFYCDGEIVEQDIAKGLELIELAARQEHAEAAVTLGSIYMVGAEGLVEADSAQGARWLQVAAGKGHAEAQALLAGQYMSGEGVEPDAEEARRLLMLSAEQDCALGQHLLGQFLDATENEAEATQWYLRAAGQGYASSQFEYGLRCCFGLYGVQQDKEQAMHWLMEAYKQGNDDALALIGKLEDPDYTYEQWLARGENEAEEPAIEEVIAEEEAIEEPAAEDSDADWRRKTEFESALKAADQWEQTEHMLVTGKYYLEGYGTEQNVQEGLYWCTRAAMQEDNWEAKVEAINFLWECYRDGKYVKKDEKIAVEWAARAANYDNAEAMAFMAESCRFGRNGVEKDLGKALEIYNELAENGDAEAEKTAEALVREFRTGAEKGDAESMYHLARCYCCADHVEEDHKQAYALFEKAAALGHEEALLEIADYLKTDNRVLGMEFNPDKARRILEAAAAKNNGGALRGLAYMEDDRDQYAKAAEYYRRAAELNDVDAMDALARRYREGKGVPKDPALCFEWARRAAANGGRMYMLAECYRDGIGTDVDLQQAAYLCLKADFGSGWLEISKQLHDEGRFSFEPTQTLEELRETLKRKSKPVEEAPVRPKPASKAEDPFEQEMYNRGVELSEMGRHAEGFELLMKAASYGHAAAQWRAGSALINGTGCQKDAVKGMELLRKSAEQGYAAGQWELGRWLHLGLIMGTRKHQSDIESKIWLRKAAAQGYAQAKADLENWFADNDGGEALFVEAQRTSDRLRAAKLYEQAAEKGHAGAQYALGMYFEGLDTFEAAQWYKKAAEQGHARAQFRLGHLFTQGEGVPMNLVEAANWLRKAAEQGDAEAQCDFGIRCYEGKGTAKNRDEAKKWLEKAAAQGSDLARVKLDNWFAEKKMSAEELFKLYEANKFSEEGLEHCRKAAEMGHIEAMYEMGFQSAIHFTYSAPVNSESIRWYRMAAERGHAKAQGMLGAMYISGDQAKQDYEEAAKWYRMAAEQGDKNAQFRLAEMAHNGNVKGISDMEARDWLEKAAAQGLQSAQELLNEWFPAKSAVDADVLFAQAEALREKKDLAKAYPLYKQAAETGHVEAIYRVGMALCKGEGVKKDAVEGTLWFMRAAEKGHAPSQYNVGWSYANGDGVKQDWTEAVRWYTKAADQGYDKAQYNLGNCYKNGNGVKQDDKEAFRRYRLAADQGHAKAREQLEMLSVGSADDIFEQGKKLLEGDGVAKDAAKAVSLFRKAAEQSHADAMNSLGWCLSKGEGTAKNPEEAHKWFVRAAEQGLDKAQFNVGYDYYWGDGVKEDNAQAFRWFEKAAEQGHVKAMDYMGRCYYSGYGAEKNYDQAAEWYRKAAEKGNSHAQNALGDCYYFGHGVSENAQTAAEWYRKSAENGLFSGMANYGYMLQLGKGVAKDYVRSLEWLRKAAAENNDFACNCMGDAYSFGWGVSKDSVQAASWYKKAAEAGHAAGMFHYAECLYTGDGVGKDLPLAKQWYEKSAAKGFGRAKEALKNRKFEEPKKRGIFGFRRK